MKVFRYHQDKIPVTMFVLFCVSDIAAFLFLDSFVLILLWSLLTIIPKGYVSAWNHHHQHCNTFRPSFLNRLLEIVYFLQTGMPGYGWTLHHVVGHHLNYLDQTKDESAWKDQEGKTMGELRYTLTVGGTSYYRAFLVGLKRPLLLLRFLSMFIVSWGLLAFFIYIKPIAGIFIFAIPAMVTLFITAWATYDHHTDLDTNDKYAASYNILDPLYNKLTGNLGYHTAHHVRCGLHWSVLPSFHSEIQNKIPGHCYREVGFPTTFIANFFQKPIQRNTFQKLQLFPFIKKGSARS